MQEIKQSSQLIDQRNGLFSKDQVQVTNKPEKKNQLLNHQKSMNQSDTEILSCPSQGDVCQESK